MMITSKEFAEYKEKNPGWSSLTTLANLVMKKKFSETELRTMIIKHVDKSDYTQKDLNNIVAYFSTLFKEKEKSNEQSDTKTEDKNL